MALDQKFRPVLLALWLLSLGGWLLHLRIHPPGLMMTEPQNPAYYIPFVVGLLNILLVPALFYFKPTAILAQLINGFSVIIGTITMAHFSITQLLSLPNLTAQLSLNLIFLKTTLPDLLLLWPKLLLGQLLLSTFYPAGFGRLFKPFWWLKHLIYLTLIYSLGVYI